METIIAFFACIPAFLLASALELYDSTTTGEAGGTLTLNVGGMPSLIEFS